MAPFVNSWLSLFYRKIKHFQLHNCSCRHSIYVTALYYSFLLKEAKNFQKCQRQNFLMELRLNLVTLSFGCFVGVEAEQTKVAWVAGWGILLNIINQLIKPHSHLIIISHSFLEVYSSIFSLIFIEICSITYLLWLHYINAFPGKGPRKLVWFLFSWNFCELA